MQPSQQFEQHRHWAFTSYGVKPTFDQSWMSYLAVGHEVCPTTGRPHWQCHVWCSTKRTFGSVKRMLGLLADGSQLSAAKSFTSSIKYCLKGRTGMWQGEPCPRNEVEEFGTPPQQGKRTDLMELNTRVLTGETTCAEIIENDPETYYKYGRVFEKAEQLAIKKRPRVEKESEVHWWYGATGTGKSRALMEAIAEDERNDDVFFYSPDGGWWDNYNGQAVIVFDDYRGDIQFDLLLKILDRYALASVRRRGVAPIRMTTKRFYFTSPLKPEEVYAGQARNAHDTIAQLLRRITDLRHFVVPRSGFEVEEKRPESPSPSQVIGSWDGDSVYDAAGNYRQVPQSPVSLERWTPPRLERQHAVGAEWFERARAAMDQPLERQLFRVPADREIVDLTRED